VSCVISFQSIPDVLWNTKDIIVLLSYALCTKKKGQKTSIIYLLTYAHIKCCGIFPQCLSSSLTKSVRVLMVNMALICDWTFRRNAFETSVNTSNHLVLVILCMWSQSKKISNKYISLYNTHDINKLLRVSTPRCHPQGVITTEVYKPACQNVLFVLTSSVITLDC